MYLICSDGTLKSTSSVPNPLDTNNQLGKSVSSQQSEVLHMTSDMKPPQKVRYSDSVHVIVIPCVRGI